MVQTAGAIILNKFKVIFIDFIKSDITDSSSNRNRTKRSYFSSICHGDVFAPLGWPLCLCWAFLTLEGMKYDLRTTIKSGLSIWRTGIFSCRFFRPGLHQSSHCKLWWGRIMITVSPWNPLYDLCINYSMKFWLQIWRKFLRGVLLSIMLIGRAIQSVLYFHASLPLLIGDLCMILVSMTVSSEGLNQPWPFNPFI